MARMREWGEDAIVKVENVVYLAVALVLAGVAAVVLGTAVAGFLDLPESGVASVAAEILDNLLLVFIVVELLFAVRTTLAERELVAEPFLIVGIIASIKEIVVLSVKAPDYVGTEKLDDTIWLIGTLTLTIGVLAVSSLLVRRKEREPSEGDGAGPDAAHEEERKEGREHERERAGGEAA